MEQTRLLLISARRNEDYSQALNALGLVAMQVSPADIENTMYAYMAAKDWCKWIKSGSSYPSENPRFESISHAPLETFNDYATKFEEQLTHQSHIIANYFGQLYPNFTPLLAPGLSSEGEKEDMRLFFRTLRYTATLLDEKFQTSYYNEILDNKQVPTMSELDIQNTR